jgi:uncharacterized membrane protein YeaQ/YmgE (transglycosylase-associated protein family)
MNMARRSIAERIVLAVALCASCAICAYGQTSESLRYQSIRQEAKTLAIVGWIVLGLTAGFIGSQLVKRRGEGILPDILVGTVGGVAGGWLYYTFGPVSVVGFNLISLAAAVFGSLAALLTYYFLRQISSRPE